MRPLAVALVGDHDPSVVAHRAVPRALALAADALGLAVAPRWLPTDAVDPRDPLAGADAAWCVPGSPYRSAGGALAAIRAAREGGVPFLGTCGGFQHGLLEYARHVLGWADAGHAEEDPGAARLVVAPLACSLVEVDDAVRFAPGSRLGAEYARTLGTSGDGPGGAVQAREGYHCRYGLNPDFAAALTAGPLRATAWDAAGDVRAVELDGHPFFAATLFQPERRALAGGAPPPAVALLRAAAARAGA